MKRTIRIGTRESDLSVAQTMLVVEALRECHPDLEYKLVPRRTLGDKILDQPLVAFGGKGVFIVEFEQALLQGEIDLAVHSAKDLPTELAEGLEIVSVLPRGDVRDVLVSMEDNQCWSEGQGPLRIGTSSLRRKLQIESLGAFLWPGRSLVCENLRGNVLTRLEKLEQGRYDGIILAGAGLERLKLQETRKGRYRYRYFSPEEMIPAGGQGILAVEGRKDDPCSRLAAAVCDQTALKQLESERLVLKLLSAGCHQPVGVYCQINEDGERFLRGIYEREGRIRQAQTRGFSFQDPERRLAASLLGNEVDR